MTKMTGAREGNEGRMDKTSARKCIITSVVLLSIGGGVREKNNIDDHT